MCEFIISRIPAHIITLDFNFLIKFWEEYELRSFSLCILFMFSCKFLSLSANILLFSDTLGLCSFLNVNNQNLHQENIVILLNLVVSFWIGDGKIKYPELM
jgi:hypothetical protein